MKKLLTSLVVLSMMLCGCQGGSSSKGFDSSNEIGVISREDGSGTRGAFIELFGVEVKNDAGEKEDQTVTSAQITNSTEVMLSSVSGDEYAIGYVSLGSLNDSVKALTIDGVEPTTVGVKDGSYTVSRPFNLVVNGDLDELTQDFVNYILSDDGQKVVEDNGYVAVESGTAYEAAELKGTITVGGSSSVSPVMEKLSEAYMELNPDVEVKVQTSDSTTGISSAIDGIVDLGMASRDLKDSETEKGASTIVIALDGIAVIVNSENTIDNLTKEQVRQIYTGEVTTWDEVEG